MGRRQHAWSEKIVKDSPTEKATPKAACQPLHLPASHTEIPSPKVRHLLPAQPRIRHHGGLELAPGQASWSHGEGLVCMYGAEVSDFHPYCAECS